MLNPVKSVTDYVTANTTTKTMTATTIFLGGCTVAMIWMFKEAAKLEDEINEIVHEFNRKNAS